MQYKGKKVEWLPVAIIIIAVIGAMYVGWKVFKSDEYVIPAETIRKQAILEQEKKQLQQDVVEYRKVIDSLSAKNTADRIAWQSEKKVLLININNKYNEERKINSNLTADEQFLLFSKWLNERISAENNSGR